MDSFDVVIVPEAHDVTDSSAVISDTYVLLSDDADDAFTNADAVSVNSLSELDDAMAGNMTLVVVDTAGGRAQQWVNIMVNAARIMRTQLHFVTGYGDSNAESRAIMFDHSDLPRIDYSRIKRAVEGRKAAARDVELAKKADERATEYGRAIDNVRNKHGVIKTYQPASAPYEASDDSESV